MKPYKAPPLKPSAEFLPMDSRKRWCSECGAALSTIEATYVWREKEHVIKRVCSLGCWRDFEQDFYEAMAEKRELEEV